ncbi:MAG: hypothetical protein U0K37_07060 [Acutalibacteraceae bacterium]|nr:hypothetical protein [Acutalibacteraceae bacterium]
MKIGRLGRWAEFFTAFGKFLKCGKNIFLISPHFEKSTNAVKDYDTPCMIMAHYYRYIREK